MRTLVHLSDLHFGATDRTVVDAVRAHIIELRPHIVVVSGDFTQRARRREFQDARAFLDSLPGKKIAVPGNHDVPLWNVLARFLRPLANYERYITPDLAPFYQDDHVAILGINTARSLTWKSGRINPDQAAQASKQLCTLDDRLIKMVVTHHPFDLADTYRDDQLVGRARMALEQLTACGTDVLLAGHFHKFYTGGTTKRYQIHGHSALVVQAGTATSTRLRGHPNSFNVLRIEPPKVAVEILTWSESGRFGQSEFKDYERRAGVGFVRL